MNMTANKYFLGEHYVEENSFDHAWVGTQPFGL